MNICEYTKRIEEKKIAFSDQAKEEIAQMKEVCSAAMKLLLPMEEMDVSALSEAAALEQKIDDLTLCSARISLSGCRRESAPTRPAFSTQRC